MGGGEGEMERGVGRERGQEGRVRDKEMDGETDRDEWLSRRVDQHMHMEGGREGEGRKEGAREGEKDGGKKGGREERREGKRRWHKVLLPHFSYSCGLQQVSAYLASSLCLFCSVFCLIFSSWS